MSKERKLNNRAKSIEDAINEGIRLTEVHCINGDHYSDYQYSSPRIREIHEFRLRQADK